MTVDASTSWLDTLPTFDAAGLRPVLDSHAGQDAAVELAGNYRFARRATRRTYLNALDISNAAEHLRELPRLGESLHCICRGNYPAFALVPAILKLSGRPRFERLALTTLGFSQQNAADIIGMIDRGEVGQLDFVASTYFVRMRNGAKTYAGFREQLLSRPGGHRIAAIRAHVKLTLAELGDGQAYCLESSANLRSCRTAEGFVLTHDSELVRFHFSWLDEVFAHGMQ